MSKAMSFYIAVFLSTSHSGTDNYLPLYEEALHLLKEDSLEAAWDRAVLLSQRDTLNFGYVAATGDFVTWSTNLVCVGPVEDESFTDGAELFSRFFRNVDAYRDLQFEDFEKEAEGP